MVSSCCNGKELEGTDEWQIVGPNDTIAAGLHVRMDLSTGEKWVKKLDDAAKIETTYDEVEIHHGAIVSSDQVSSGVASKEYETTTTATARKDAELPYDYEMMYRTLSALPDDVKAELRLPKPPVSEEKMSNEQYIEERSNFEARMKEIWENRQRDLLEFSEQHVAELPRILNDRIASLRAYLLDPQSHLRALQNSRKDCDPMEMPRNESNNTQSSSDMTILEVLLDLEYHLSDIDMTRDFYSLGGWTILASFLLDEIHMDGETNLQEPHQRERLMLTDEIQAHVAWALGTAVKNIGEFRTFVLDRVLKDDDRTVLDLVLYQLAEAHERLITETTVDAPEKIETSKLAKLLYCLGSFLRGNPDAISHFLDHRGSNILFNFLSSHKSVPAQKITKRVLTIISDLLLFSEEETTLENIGSDGIDHGARLKNAFSTPEFCQLWENAHRVFPDIVSEIARNLPPPHYCPGLSIEITTDGTNVDVE